MLPILARNPLDWRQQELEGALDSIRELRFPYNDFTYSLYTRTCNVVLAILQGWAQARSFLWDKQRPSSL